MAINSVSVYAAATFIWAAPAATVGFASTADPLPERHPGPAATVAKRAATNAGLLARDRRDPASLAVPYRSALEALIVQMGGATRPSGKGVFVDLRV